MKQKSHSVLLLLLVLFLLAAVFFPSCGGEDKKGSAGDDIWDSSVIDGNDTGVDDDDDNDDDNYTSGMLDPDNPFGGISDDWNSTGGSVTGEKDGKAASNHKLRSAGVTEMTSESYRLFIGSLDTAEPVYQKNNSYQIQVTW